MDVICFGSATKDVFVYITPKVLNHNICFYPGTKLEIEELDIFSGGGATNAGVSFSRLGLKTGIVSVVGADLDAEMICSELKSEKVNTFGIFKDKSKKTARSVILTGFGRDRVVLTYSKILGSLNEKHIPWKKLKSKWFYISSLHTKPLILKKLIDFAGKKGIKVALNPGSVELKSNKKQLFDLFKKVDVLLLNAQEALSLTHKASVEKNLFELSKYAKTVVITKGKHGSFAQSEGKTFFQKPFNAKVVDVTGAGDAFGSAFVASLMRGKGVKHALAAGTANANSVIQFLGTKNILLSQTKLNTLIKKFCKT